jgi:Dynamin central region
MGVLTGRQCANSVRQRNRNAQEMQISFFERERKEKQFFATTDWSQLPDDNLGIVSLRTRLSDLLYQHIKQELPGLRKELDAIYTRTETQLHKLGESRATIQQQRQYLTGLSIKFHDLTRAAATGLYGKSYPLLSRIHCTFFQSLGRALGYYLAIQWHLNFSFLVQ